MDKYGTHIECVDAVCASMSSDEFIAYCKGTTIKNVFDYKSSQDLEKLKTAQLYLTWMIEEVESHV